MRLNKEKHVSRVREEEDQLESISETLAQEEMEEGICLGRNFSVKNDGFMYDP